MAALDPAVGAEPHRHENIAAEGLYQSNSLPGSNRSELCLDGTVRQALHDLLEQPQALLDFADADPDARIDVAVSRTGTSNSSRS